MKRSLGLRVVTGALFVSGLAAASCTAMTPDEAIEGETAAVEQSVVPNPNLKYFGTTMITARDANGAVIDDRLKEVRDFSNVTHVMVVSPNELIGTRLAQLRAEGIKALIDVSQIFFQENPASTYTHCDLGVPVANSVSQMSQSSFNANWATFIANNNLTDPNVKAGILAFMFADEPGYHHVSMNDLNTASQYIKSTLNHTSTEPVRTMYVESSSTLYHRAEYNPAVTVFGNMTGNYANCVGTYLNYLTAASTPSDVDYPSVDIYYQAGVDRNGGTAMDGPHVMELTLNRFNNALRPGQKMFVFGQADHDHMFSTDRLIADTLLEGHSSFLFDKVKAASATNVMGYMTWHWGWDGFDPIDGGPATCIGAGSKLPDGSWALPKTRDLHLTQGNQVLPGGNKTIFDFATSLPAGVTYSRGSTGTYFNANGIMQTAAANAPRIEYYNGQSMGLLLEPAATNLLCKSEALEFTAAATTCNWKRENVNVGANVASPLAPTNAQTTEQIVESVTSTPTTHGIYQNVAMTASRKYVFSAFVKPELITQVALVGVNKAGTPQTAMFNLTGNGSIVAGSLPSAGIVKYGSWYRVMIALDSGTGAAQPAVGVYLAKNSATQYQGTSTNFKLNVWGAQLELGASTSVFPNPTSYIKTDTASATRSADNLDLAVTPLANSQGTFSVEIADVLQPAVDDTIGSTLLHFDDWNAGATNYAWDVKVDSASKVNLKVVTGTSTVLANQTSANSLGAGYQAKFAFAYADSGPREIVSGLGTVPTPNFTPAVANPTSTISGTWTRMFVGRNGAGAARFTGHVRTIRFFPYDVYGGGAAGKTLEFKDLTLVTP